MYGCHIWIIIPLKDLNYWIRLSYFNRMDLWKGLKEKLRIELSDYEWKSLLDVLINPELENMILVEELTNVLSYFGINEAISGSISTSERHLINI